MSITALPLKASTLIDVLTEHIYLDGKHDCCSLEEFDPEDCPPCEKCGHCAARHQDLPVGRGVCDAETCECFHFTSIDDCERCSGTGTVADSNDNEYACIKCDGHGVVS